MECRVKIGISACLLGEKVRYDGGHKLERQLSEALARRFLLVPVCPEVGCGLSVPREPMRLEGDPAEPRLVVIRTGLDLSRRLRSYCRQLAESLEREGICGFVFKKNSPSCGLHRVQVYLEGLPGASGRGLLAAEVVRRFASLPVEQEDGLADPVFREKFVERVRAYSLESRSCGRARKEEQPPCT